jgi:hypothetical protein
VVIDRRFYEVVSCQPPISVLGFPTMFKLGVNPFADDSGGASAARNCQGRAGRVRGEANP